MTTGVPTDTGVEEGEKRKEWKEDGVTAGGSTENWRPES